MELTEIKAAYITGTQSLCDLAQAAQISYSRLSRLARQEDWRTLRQQHRQSGAQSSDALASDALHSAAAQMCNYLQQLLRDERSRYAAAPEGLRAADLRGLRDLAGAIKEMAAIVRELDGSQTAQQAVQIRFSDETARCTG